MSKNSINPLHEDSPTGRRRAEDATTPQPRATPWETQAKQTGHALKGQNSICSTTQAVFDNNLPRLLGINRKYDPSNFFRRNSNVSPM